jgi:hypothetical protein
MPKDNIIIWLDDNIIIWMINLFFPETHALLKIHTISAVKGFTEFHIQIRNVPFVLRSSGFSVHCTMEVL